MRTRVKVTGVACLVSALVAASGILIARAGDPAELPRPNSARVSGNTWCGPLTRLASASALAIYSELARYVDAGAKVVAYSEVEGSETFVLCGRIRGNTEE